MLEDDSGRIKLVGYALRSLPLVTGCIIAVMGSENANGELEVIDVKFAELAPQPARWTLTSAPANGDSQTKVKDEDTEMTDGPSKGKKIAIASGLSFSNHDTSYSLQLELLLEYLLGESLSTSTQESVSQISRLFIAGNSIATTDTTNPVVPETTSKKVHKKYGYDSSAYNPLPSQLFDDFLGQILPSIPVTLLPGVQDPANASYPQQSIHAAMFPRARAYCAAPKSEEPGWFDCVTNPWEGEVEGWRVLGTGGQNVDDVFKYLGSEDRLGMMEAMCRWRCSAPTAPDTLCELYSVRVPNLSNSIRVLSLSGQRPVRHERMSAPLLCRQPAAILHQNHRRPRWPNSPTHHCPRVFRIQRISTC